MQRPAWAAVLLGIAMFTVAAATSAERHQQTRPAFAGVLDEHPAIQYARRPARDRVAMLNRAIVEGTTSLTFHGQGGYLRSVLDALGVPAESQLLVFSKTGIQS